MWAPAQQFNIDSDKRESESPVDRPSSAAAALSTPNHRLAFSATPKRPPTFTCCLSPRGHLHIAMAEGAELRWSVASDSTDSPTSTTLSGHKDQVTALALIYHKMLRRTLLVSASATDVLLHWRLSPSGNDDEAAAAGSARCRCVGLLSPLAEGLDLITNVTLSVPFDDDIWFAASVGQECVAGMVPSGLIAGTGGKPRIACRLTGHEAAVTATALVPAPSSKTLLLVSASEDRTLKVWDIGATTFVYSTPIVSAAPFTSLAVHPASQRVAAGSADGRLWLYSLSARDTHAEQAQPSWCLESVAMISLAPKSIALRSSSHERAIDATPDESIPVVYSKPQWKQSVPLESVLEGSSSENMQNGEAEDGEATYSVSALAFAALMPPATQDELLEATDVPHLLAATATTLLHVNTRNHSVTTLFPFARGFGDNGEGMGIARSVVCCATNGIAVDEDDFKRKAAGRREQRIQRMQMEPEPQPQAQSQPHTYLKVACGVSAAFEPVLAVFTLPASSCNNGDGSAAAQDSSPATVFTSADEELTHLCFPAGSTAGEELLDGPIGRGLQLTAQCRGTKVGGGGLAKAARRRKGGKLVDKPTTFHTKIASSGYGRDNGNRGTGRGRSRGRRSVGAAARGRGAVASRGAGRKRGHFDENRDDWEAPTVPQPHHTITQLHNGPICCADFAVDGSRLATCSTDQTAHCVRLPVSKHSGDGVTCTGHTGRVSSVSFGSRGDLLITAGDDRTARVWVAGRAEPALLINSIERNPPPAQQTSSPSTFTASSNAMSLTSSTARGSGPNHTFRSEIVAAQFFHGDKLMLVGCGNSIGMYGYSLERGGSSGDRDGAQDYKPHLSQGRYRRAHSYTLGGSPTLTALAAVNGAGLATSTLLAAGSNKVLELIDANYCGHRGEGKDGGTILAIPNAHNRAVHRIALMSSAATGSASGQNASVFLTAATDGALKLWDVRDPGARRGQCVQLWTAHTNRVHPIGAELSACGRFAACGSEDKLAYVYDLRQSDGMDGKQVLWKLRGHTDVVLDVAFNPVHPQLATVGADARLLFFCDGGR